jgi:hypothetical protein
MALDQSLLSCPANRWKVEQVVAFGWVAGVH